MSDNSKDRAIPITGLLILCAALGVMIFTKNPFEESRPSVQEIREPYQKINARLWQDPFLAVLNDERTGKASTSKLTESVAFANHSTSKSTESGILRLYSTAEKGFLSADFNKKKADGNVTVVGEMVFGAPYAEEGELRIRHRYAALSAFRRLGFVPDDAEHIEYMRLEHSKEDKQVQGPVTMANIMPFEWLHKVNNKKDSILLLWINDDVFQKQPLDKLRFLANSLGLSATSPSLEQTSKFKVIGPAGSTTLKEMLSNTTNEIENSSKRLADIFSPTATVDSASLLQMYGDSAFVKDPERNVEFRFKKAGFPLKRTICSDKDLAEKITGELKLRGIDCGNLKNHIVLISEWDTYYGQSIAEIYKRVLFHSGVVNVDKQIHTYSYLRGLDGKVPLNKEDNEPADKKTADKINDATKEMEGASGGSQLDYLRRLADEIYLFDQHLAGRGSIKAIGILGSDFHDKYLVLQALRQRFPQKVFFTTDLDARMLHPEATRWTRNLIVASSFNLSLRNDDEINVQGDVPPFRDSYQTSIFFSILRAFSRDEYLSANLQDILLQKPTPKIFEIGKTRAVDLSEDPRSTRSFHPPQHEVENSKATFKKVIMVAFLVFVLLAFSSEQMRAFLSKALSGKKPAVATVLSLFIVSIVTLAFYRGILLNPQEEEPFSLLEGVSIWPTEILRLVAALLSLFFIWLYNDKIEKNAIEISQEFGFFTPLETSATPEPKSAPKIKDKTGIVGDIQHMFRKFSEVVRYDWSVASSEGKDMTIDHYWSEYCRRESIQYRVRRLAPIIASYTALCGLLVSFSMPETPVRGTASMVADKVILGVSVISFILLIFYVFDVTRICHRFIKLLTNQTPHWTNNSFIIFSGQLETGATDAMKELMLIHLIAKRTGIIGQLIFYPFIVWVIMFVSRLNYFDNWHMPIGLMIVTSLGAVYAWSCALLLRRAAEHLRTAALGRLAHLQSSIVAREKIDEEKLKRVEFAINSINFVREGAFSPFTQNPVVQALFVPLGGVGGVYAMDFLGKLNF